MKLHAKVVVLAFVAIPTITISGLAQPAPEPAKKVWVARAFGGDPVPLWTNGRLLAFERESTASSVFSYDADGNLKTKSVISIPDSIRTILRSPVASGDGRIAVAGSAFSSGNTGASFIVFIQPSGAVERIVRTAPFSSMLLCFGTDGMLWAAGTERSADLKYEQPHNVLHRYSPDGRLSASYLPRSEFTKETVRHPAEESFLVAGKDRIGFYSVLNSEWIEVGNSGEVMGRWKGLDNQDCMISGVGLTDSGNVYASLRRNNPARPGFTFRNTTV